MPVMPVIPVCIDKSVHVKIWGIWIYFKIDDNVSWVISVINVAFMVSGFVLETFAKPSSLIYKALKYL
jgi:hypothetical protein